MELITALRLLMNEDVGVYGPQRSVLIRPHKIRKGILCLLFGEIHIAYKYVGDTEIQLRDVCPIYELPDNIVKFKKYIYFHDLFKGTWT